MTPIASIHVFGLKCDAEGCGYRDDSVAGSDYEKWLDVPCPRCGAPLLTQADLDATRAIEAAVAAINEIADKLGLNTGEATAVASRKITMRGDGSICFSAPKIEAAE